MASELRTRTVLLATGMTDHAIRAATRAGDLYAVERGVYADRPLAAPWDEYVRRVRAAAMRRPTGVVSHESAAALHGIPVLRGTRDRIHFTVDGAGGGLRRGRHIHAQPLRPEDITRVEGIAVTSRARTALDIATAGDLERGIGAIDAVRLRRRYPDPSDPPSVSYDELSDALESMRGRRGVALAKRALGLSVDCSESIGESLSRCLFREWNLPEPALQRCHAVGDRVYWADFDWEGRLVGEFDGLGKYDTPERIEREKQRDSELQQAGIDVVHWTWVDTRNRLRLFRIITHAMVRTGVLPAIPPFPG